MEASRIGTGAKSKERLTWKWHWTREEDEALIKLVKRHGPGNWKYIANHIDGRTGMSCRLRWVNHLNPKVDKTPFSEEEQEKLLELHREFGNKWSTIVSFFPGRTDNQLKNQYHALISRNMKLISSPSSSTNYQGCLNMGSVVLSGPDILWRGSKCIGCAGCLSMNRDETKTPFSYLCNNVHSFENGNVGNVYATLGKNHNSMTFGAGSAATSEGYPVSLPRHAVSVKNDQFIDFLGVGNSE